MTECPLDIILFIFSFGAGSRINQAFLLQICLLIEVSFDFSLREATTLIVLKKVAFMY